MSQVKPSNYFEVQGWMLTELDLKGTDLMIYAIIYGFSQYEGQSFTASIQYLADWTNSSRRTVIYALNSLMGRGLLRKKESIFNGVKFCEYRAVAPEMQILHGGGAKIAPNNTEDNKEREINNSKELFTKRFIPPTVEEVSAYVQEKGYRVDPERFIDYYTATGWMYGKTKMKDWKAAVRNWQRNSKSQNNGFDEKEFLRKLDEWGIGNDQE